MLQQPMMLEITVATTEQIRALLKKWNRTHESMPPEHKQMYHLPMETCSLVNITMDDRHTLEDLLLQFTGPQELLQAFLVEVETQFSLKAKPAIPGMLLRYSLHPRLTATNS